MSLLLGFDQGSTKTHAVVSDFKGRLLAFGTAAGSLHTMRGMEDALRQLRSAAEGALKGCGAAWQDIGMISGGITGIDYPFEQELLTRTLREHFGVQDVVVHNDCIGALWGGTFEGPAVVCCAGTGLNLGGINASGEVRQLGNYANGIYQGGGSIGQNALQAVFDAHIRKAPPTILRDMFLRKFSCADVDELLVARYRQKKVHPPSLCPLVFQAAGDGDQVALRILTECAQNWAEFVLSLMYLLGIRRQEPVRVILSGGVFKGKPDIPRQHITQVLSAALPRAEVVLARFEPVVGGAVMGLRVRGQDNWQDNVERSAVGLGLLRHKEDEHEA